jgi:hypothetical protein
MDAPRRRRHPRREIDSRRNEMEDVTSVVDAYFAMWNEPDPARRDELIARAFAEDGRYVDPIVDATGHTGIAAMVAGAQAQFPGHWFERVSRIDRHHDHVRFAWELHTPDGEVAITGLDVAELAADGRLRQVAGFFEELAAA